MWVSIIRIGGVGGTTIFPVPKSLFLNLLNEAAIYAVRHGSDEISPEDIDRAIDRLTLDIERKTGKSSTKRQNLAAWHEAGPVPRKTPGFRGFRGSEADHRLRFVAFSFEIIIGGFNGHPVTKLAK